jgi:hypothetical protein
MLYPYHVVLWALGSPCLAWRRTAEVLALVALTWELYDILCTFAPLF